MLKSLIKKNVPAFGLRWLHKIGLVKHYIPTIGRIHSNDFDRITPFSTDFGYDRGGPIDRYFIESFLRQHSDSIQGRVLEIGDNEYTVLFGKEKVLISDVLHVQEGNPKATFVGDISNAPQIPDNIFNCIVLTQTLHLIYDFKGALQTCHRILKPGGVLLLTVPYITPIAHGQWKEIWYWAFTDRVLQQLIVDIFPCSEYKIQSYGNVYTASAFLYGMGLKEVPKNKLDHHDSHFQVVNAVKVTKSPTL